MNTGLLADRIMMVAAECHIQPGQPLPTKAFDLFLDENPEQTGAALMQLYLNGLLEEVPHEVDLLTEKGFKYCRGLSLSDLAGYAGKSEGALLPP